MRLLEKLTLVLSQDNIASPKNVLFSIETEVADIVTLTKAKTINESFPVGDTIIDLGNIGAGKYIYIKPAANVVVDLGNGPITFLAGKESKLWTSFTELTITVVTAPNDIFLVVAGS